MSKVESVCFSENGNFSRMDGGVRVGLAGWGYFVSSWGEFSLLPETMSI